MEYLPIFRCISLIIHRDHYCPICDINILKMSVQVLILSACNYIATALTFVYCPNVYRLFSEGGNYCPEEVDLFVKKLVSYC